MKKYVKKSILCCLFVALILFVSCISRAATLNIDYNNKEDLEKDNFKLYAGDEVFISFCLDDNDGNPDKIMAIYGKVEYDSDVLELVKVDGKDYGDNPKVGDGWLAGSINEKDNTFFFYTLDDKRSDNVGFIKFRVKSDIDRSTETLFSAKDVTLYKKVNNSNYEESSTVEGNLDLKIKINSKKGDMITIATFIAVIVAIVICILIYRRCMPDGKNDKVVDTDSNNPQNNGEDNKKDVELKEKNVEEKDVTDKVDSVPERTEKKENSTNKKEDIEEKLKKLTIAKEKLEKATGKIEKCENEKVESDKDLNENDMEKNSKQKTVKEKEELKETKNQKEEKEKEKSKKEESKKEQEKSKQEEPEKKVEENVVEQKEDEKTTKKTATKGKSSNGSSKGNTKKSSAKKSKK